MLSLYSRSRNSTVLSPIDKETKGAFCFVSIPKKDSTSYSRCSLLPPTRPMLVSRAVPRYTKQMERSTFLDHLISPSQLEHAYHTVLKNRSITVFQHRNLRRYGCACVRGTRLATTCHRN